MNSEAPIVELIGIHKTYGHPVLAGVDLECRRGEVTWIKGASGSGKSTLLNVLGLLSTADSGVYHLNGVAINGASIPTLTRLRQRTVSTIFQRGNLFDHLTVAENIRLGIDRANTADVNTVLSDVSLADRATDRAGLMSGGEQQRIAVARALIRTSPLILADEPTSSLDETNARAILSLLRLAAEAGAAVVVASHDGRTGDIADVAFELERGTLR